jgi:hypothetical protein
MRRGLQARSPHILVVGDTWDLRHPAPCADHAQECPFTFALETDAPAVLPGLPGAYACRLDAFGVLRIGRAVPMADTSEWSSTLVPRKMARRG